MFIVVLISVWFPEGEPGEHIPCISMENLTVYSCATLLTMVIIAKL